MLGMSVLLVFGFLMTRPPEAEAAVLKNAFCYYYSDATHSEVVGFREYRCNNTVVYTEGTVTAYSDCYKDWCCGSVWC
jgi:hypothetical protein